jgi:hypothetical protein
MRNMRNITSILFGLSFAFAAQGCWMMMDIYVPGDDTDTDSESESDSDSDSDSDSETIEDTECDETGIAVYNDAARVLILLDHSSSMEGTNWNVARNAIYDLLDEFSDGTIWFGLDTLPDPEAGDCSVSAPVAVDCGPGTGTAISSALASMSTFVSTPLYDAMAELTDPGYAPGCAEADSANYVLLVADGEDSCSYPTTEDFLDLTSELVGSGIRVMVVGFNVNMDSAQLNTIAGNGGTEFTTYLNASDGPSLTAALETVAGSVDSCFYTIISGAALSEPGLVNLYMDGELLPMDEDCSSGWGWRWADEGLVELCEASCAALEDGDADELTATFGCETFEG